MRYRSHRTQAVCHGLRFLDLVLTECCVLPQDDGSYGSGGVECGQVHGIAYFAVDNGYDFYVDGVHIGAGNDWTQTDRFVFQSSCDTPTVYGIDAYDQGGIASILGTIYHCDEMILTSSAWKCAPRCDAACTQGADGGDVDSACEGVDQVGCTDSTHWTDPAGVTFDDWWWTDAADAGDNGALPWGHRPDVSGEAHWIWSADADGHDEVRCRYETSHTVLNCPAAQSRYWEDNNDVAAADVTSASTAGSIGMEAYTHFMAYGKNEGRI